PLARLSSLVGRALRLGPALARADLAVAPSGVPVALAGWSLPPVLGGGAGLAVGRLPRRLGRGGGPALAARVPHALADLAQAVLHALGVEILLLRAPLRRLLRLASDALARIHDLADRMTAIGLLPGGARGGSGHVLHVLDRLAGGTFRLLRDLVRGLARRPVLEARRRDREPAGESEPERHGAHGERLLLERVPEAAPDAVRPGADAVPHPVATLLEPVARPRTEALALPRHALPHALRRGGGALTGVPGDRKSVV